MKKYIIAAYFIGAIFTNSYIRVHRVEDWIEGKKKYCEHAVGMKLTTSDISGIVTGSYVESIVATIIWPLYLTFKASDAIMASKVKIEAPEILQ